MKFVELANKKENTKCGNHKVIVLDNGNKHFQLYSTIIAKCNPILRVFCCDRSYGTMTTKKACTLYEREFLSCGYTMIDDFNDITLGGAING